MHSYTKYTIFLCYSSTFTCIFIISHIIFADIQFHLFHLSANTVGTKIKDTNLHTVSQKTVFIVHTSHLALKSVLTYKISLFIIQLSGMTLLSGKKGRKGWFSGKTPGLFIRINTVYLHVFFSLN
jgi:hypothetical protein